MPATESSGPATAPVAASTNGTVRAKRTRPAATGTPIEQAIGLRDGLLVAARQANELIRSLKRQKRQARLVQSTFDSLKALQKVAG